MNTNVWHLNANEVETAEDDDECLTHLWLAAKKADGIRYLTMARRQDSHDVYVERDDQGWSCYGGIEKVRLFPDGLSVHLNANGMSSLGGVSRLNVAFGVEVKPSYENIESVLRLLLVDGFLSVE